MNHDNNWHDSIHLGGGFAVQTLRSPAMTTATALTQWERWLAMMAQETRSVWRQAPNGSAAEIWTRVRARLQLT